MRSTLMSGLSSRTHATVSSLSSPTHHIFSPDSIDPATNAVKYWHYTLVKEEAWQWLVYVQTHKYKKYTFNGELHRDHSARRLQFPLKNNRNAPALPGPAVHQDPQSPTGNQHHQDTRPASPGPQPANLPPPPFPGNQHFRGNPLPGTAPESQPRPMHAPDVGPSRAPLPLFMEPPPPVPDGPPQSLQAAIEARLRDGRPRK